MANEDPQPGEDITFGKGDMEFLGRTLSIVSSAYLDGDVWGITYRVEDINHPDPIISITREGEEYDSWLSGKWVKPQFERTMIPQAIESLESKGFLIPKEFRELDESYCESEQSKERIEEPPCAWLDGDIDIEFTSPWTRSKDGTNSINGTISYPGACYSFRYTENQEKRVSGVLWTGEKPIKEFGDVLEGYVRQYLIWVSQKAPVSLQEGMQVAQPQPEKVQCPYCGRINKGETIKYCCACGKRLSRSC